MTHGSGASQQIIQLCQQAAQTELQMTREMLQQYKGQDFDMGYLGQQIIAHTRMLAELRAARNAVPPELQQLIQQAEQSTEQHLEMAKKLAMKLDGDSSSGERGERGERKDRKERKSEERDNS